MNVYVTGIGIICSIGHGAEQSFRSLEQTISGVKFIEEYQLYLGVVGASNKLLCSRFGAYDPYRSRTDLLAAHAGLEAWGENKNHPKIRTAVISSTSVGGVDKMEGLYLERLEDPSADNFSLMTYDNSTSTEFLAEQLGLSGSLATISTACSSGANAIMQAGRYIEHGLADRVVAGGADPISLFNIKGFSSLNIYDPEHCKPFDQNRSGLNMGEGAAYLVLESQKSLDITGNKVLCRLSGWGNASDAFHQTGSSPDGKGSLFSMSASLEKAALSAEHISYINAHGTGTQNNDLSESMAMISLFGKSPPAFSSTKAFTGHTLAAAGAIESVFCVLSIINQCLLPNLNFSLPLEETGLVPVTTFAGCCRNIHELKFTKDETGAIPTKSKGIR